MLSDCNVYISLGIRLRHKASTNICLVTLLVLTNLTQLTEDKTKVTDAPVPLVCQTVLTATILNRQFSESVGIVYAYVWHTQETPSLFSGEIPNFEWLMKAVKSMFLFISVGVFHLFLFAPLPAELLLLWELQCDRLNTHVTDNWETFFFQITKMFYFSHLDVVFGLVLVCVINTWIHVCPWLQEVWLPWWLTGKQRT